MTSFLIEENGWNSGIIIICLHGVCNNLIEYFANWTGIIFADNSHFVNTSVTNGFMVTFTNSNELSYLST